jgi:hypothetical protein
VLAAIEDNLELRQNNFPEFKYKVWCVKQYFVKLPRCFSDNDKNLQQHARMKMQLNLRFSWYVLEDYLTHNTPSRKVSSGQKMSTIVLKFNICLYEYIALIEKPPKLAITEQEN